MIMIMQYFYALFLNTYKYRLRVMQTTYRMCPEYASANYDGFFTDNKIGNCP